MEKIKQKFAIWFARKFPFIALWCFIVVYAEDGNCPAEDYKIKYDHWKAKYKLKDF